MNIIQLESFWHDQTCKYIKISVSRMRNVLIMFYQKNVTDKLLIQ